MDNFLSRWFKGSQTENDFVPKKENYNYVLRTDVAVCTLIDMAGIKQNQDHVSNNFANILKNFANKTDLEDTLKKINNLYSKYKKSEPDKPNMWYTKVHKLLETSDLNRLLNRFLLNLDHSYTLEEKERYSETAHLILNHINSAIDGLVNSSK